MTFLCLHFLSTLLVRFSIQASSSSNKWDWSQIQQFFNPSQVICWVACGLLWQRSGKCQRWESWSQSSFQKPKTLSWCFHLCLFLFSNELQRHFAWYQIPINHLAGSIIVIWITSDKSIVRSFQISKRSTGLMFKYYTRSEIIKLEARSGHKV